MLDFDVIVSAVAAFEIAAAAAAVVVVVAAAAYFHFFLIAILNSIMNWLQ